MKYALTIAALLVALMQQQPALAQGGDLVKQAVAAEGGPELRALKGLALPFTRNSFGASVIRHPPDRPNLGVRILRI